MDFVPAGQVAEAILPEAMPGVSGFNLILNED